MTPEARPAGRLHYQVKVAGRMSPMLRSAFADLGAVQITTTTVFRLHLAPELGPAEIAAMLERKGLLLLRAHPVPGPASGAVHA